MIYYDLPIYLLKTTKWYLFWDSHSVGLDEIISDPRRSVANPKRSTSSVASTTCDFGRFRGIFEAQNDWILINHHVYIMVYSILVRNVRVGCVWT